MSDKSSLDKEHGAAGSAFEGAAEYPSTFEQTY
jgi:hypothetical protein